MVEVSGENCLLDKTSVSAFAFARCLCFFWDALVFVLGGTRSKRTEFSACVNGVLIKSAPSRGVRKVELPATGVVVDKNQGISRMIPVLWLRCILTAA